VTPFFTSKKISISQCYLLKKNLNHYGRVPLLFLLITVQASFNYNTFALLQNILDQELNLRKKFILLGAEF